MNDELEKLRQAFGKAMLARDHEALDVLLAPWIGVASTIELIDKSSIDRSGQFHGSSRHVSYEELGQNSAHISPQVNAGNYVGWSSISFTAQTASDTSRLDLVFAAVRLADGLHVGSLEAAAQD